MVLNIWIRQTLAREMCRPIRFHDGPGAVFPERVFSSPQQFKGVGFFFDILGLPLLATMQ